MVCGGGGGRGGEYKFQLIPALLLVASIDRSIFVSLYAVLIMPPLSFRYVRIKDFHISDSG